MADPILLIGGGFLGRAIARALVARGEEVLLVDRHGGVGLEGLSDVAKEWFLEPHHFRPWLSRARAVIHAASTSTPGSTAGEPLVELETNLKSTLALLRALQQVPEVPLIYLSSGGTLYGGLGPNVAVESSPTHLYSYHGAAKLAAESFIQAWCNQFEGSATVLRPSNVYGPRQPERAGFGVIPAIFGKLLRNEVMRLWGDGSAERDYLYIEDFVRLCLKVVDDSPRGFLLLNACSGASVNLRNLIALAEDVTGRALRIHLEPGRAVDAPGVCMSAARAHALFGWTARVPLREGLEHTWRWCTSDAAR